MIMESNSKGDYKKLNIFDNERKKTNVEKEDLDDN